MYRIDNNTASTTLPVPKPVGVPGFFTEGTIGGVQATIVEADFLNQVQEELMAILAAASFTPSKTTNNQVIQAILYLIANNTRQRLTGPFNLYVSTSGSDTNNGLTPTTAFRTVQAAWDYIMTRLDVGKQTVTVNIADGTYAPFQCNGVPVGAESQEIIFQGDLANPAAVVIASPDNTPAVEVYGGAYARLQGFQVQGNLDGIYAGAGAAVYVSNLIFGACGRTQLLCDQHSLIEIVGPYTINGGAQSHMSAEKGGHIGSGLVSSLIVTLLGTPTFSVCYAFCSANGTMDHNYGMTFNGAANGKKFAVSINSSISAHNNINYFPGSTAGTVDAATFGVYS
jgi:hypothetical protein